MKGLIVDIGGVLTNAAAWLDAVDRLAARLGLDRPGLLSAIYGGSDDTVLVGRMPEEEWWTVVGERLGTEPAEICHDLQVTETWDNPLVAELRKAKELCRTALLSNAWPSQRTRMEALGAGDLVHEVLLSCEIGAAKPDERAFELALERLGTTADSTLFIDDTPGHVEVARRLGMRAHVHVDIEATTSVIREFTNAC